MRPLAMASVLAGLLALGGCVSAAISAAGVAGSAAMEGISDKSVHRIVPSPLAGARLAALKTVERMSMAVVKDQKGRGRWIIEAKSENREVRIKLVALGDARVRMSLHGGSGRLVITEDSDTAAEFSAQMGLELSRLTFAQVRIATAQMLLSDLGYDVPSAEGRLDFATRRAVRDFQRKTRVPADGKVDAALIRSLRDAYERATSAPNLADEPENQT